jgi:hypothetical protein
MILVIDVMCMLDYMIRLKEGFDQQRCNWDGIWMLCWKQKWNSLKQLHIEIMDEDHIVEKICMLNTEIGSIEKKSLKSRRNKQLGKYLVVW